MSKDNAPLGLGQGQVEPAEEGDQLWADASSEDTRGELGKVDDSTRHGIWQVAAGKYYEKSLLGGHGWVTSH